MDSKAAITVHINRQKLASVKIWIRIYKCKYVFHLQYCIIYVHGVSFFKKKSFLTIAVLFFGFFIWTLCFNWQLMQCVREYSRHKHVNPIIFMFVCFFTVESLYWMTFFTISYIFLTVSSVSIVDRRVTHRLRYLAEFSHHPHVSL